MVSLYMILTLNTGEFMDKQNFSLEDSKLIKVRISEIYNDDSGPNLEY